MTDAEIVEHALRLDRVAEACQLVSYDPNVGRVPEHWVPHWWVRELCAAAAEVAARIAETETIRPDDDCVTFSKRVASKIRGPRLLTEPAEPLFEKRSNEVIVGTLIAATLAEERAHVEEKSNDPDLDALADAVIRAKGAVLRRMAQLSETS